MQEVKRKARADKKAAENADGLAAKRLELLNDMKTRLKVLNEELAETENNLTSAEGKLEEESKLREQLERMQTIAKEINQAGEDHRPSRRRWEMASSRGTADLRVAHCWQSAVSNTPHHAGDTRRLPRVRAEGVANR